MRPSRLKLTLTRRSLFPGLFEAIYATFQEYCLVCVENVAKVMYPHSINHLSSH